MAFGYAANVSVVLLNYTFISKNMVNQRFECIALRVFSFCGEYNLRTQFFAILKIYRKRMTNLNYLNLAPIIILVVSSLLVLFLVVLRQNTAKIEYAITILSLIASIYVLFFGLPEFLLSLGKNSYYGLKFINKKEFHFSNQIITSDFASGFSTLSLIIALLAILVNYFLLIKNRLIMPIALLVLAACLLAFHSENYVYLIICFEIISFFIGYIFLKEKQSKLFGFNLLSSFMVFFSVSAIIMSTGKVTTSGIVSSISHSSNTIRFIVNPVMAVSSLFIALVLRIVFLLYSATKRSQASRLISLMQLPIIVFLLLLNKNIFGAYILLATQLAVPALILTTCLMLFIVKKHRFSGQAVSLPFVFFLLCTSIVFVVKPNETILTVILELFLVCFVSSLIIQFLTSKAVEKEPERFKFILSLFFIMPLFFLQTYGAIFQLLKSLVESEKYLNLTFIGIHFITLLTFIFVKIISQLRNSKIHFQSAEKKEMIATFFIIFCLVTIFNLYSTNINFYIRKTIKGF